MRPPDWRDTARTALLTLALMMLLLAIATTAILIASIAAGGTLCAS